MIKPAFRAKQIYSWVYHKYVDSFEKMKNLPKAMREKLDSEFTLRPLKMLTVQDSVDGSRKYLFELHDGHTVEVVLLLMRDKEYHEDGSLKHQERYTVCISSQVGCKVGCAFCLTAKGGFMRDLTAGEIVEQVRQIKRDNDIDANRRVNLVFMGMGEPLLNIENLFGALEILSAVPLFNYSPTRLMISTVGIPEKMITFSARFPRVRLALSLHSARPSVREALMPFAQRYPLDQLAPVLKTLSESGKIMVEYLMLKGVNDQLEDLEALMHYLKGLRVHINLIPFNAFPGCSLEGTSREDRKAFATKLKKQGFETTLRHSFGTDIAAACGQLAQRKNLS
jgi:23S rRNA (adenine2503-C2)-methyltransferase